MVLRREELCCTKLTNLVVAVRERKRRTTDTSAGRGSIVSTEPILLLLMSQPQMKIRRPRSVIRQSRFRVFCLCCLAKLLMHHLAVPRLRRAGMQVTCYPLLVWCLVHAVTHLMRWCDHALIGSKAKVTVAAATASVAALRPRFSSTQCTSSFTLVWSSEVS
jgi:hypothetical protein